MSLIRVLITVELSEGAYDVVVAIGMGLLWTVANVVGLGYGFADLVLFERDLAADLARVVGAEARAAKKAD